MLAMGLARADLVEADFPRGMSVGILQRRKQGQQSQLTTIKLPNDGWPVRHIDDYYRLDRSLIKLHVFTSLWGEWPLLLTTL